MSKKINCISNWPKTITKLMFNSNFTAFTQSPSMKITINGLKLLLTTNLHKSCSMMMWKNKMAMTRVKKLNFWMIDKIGKEPKKKIIGKKFRKMVILLSWREHKKDRCNVARSSDRGTELQKRSQNHWRDQTWKMWCKDVIKMWKMWCGNVVLMKNTTQERIWRSKTERAMIWGEERGASQWNWLGLVRVDGKERMWEERRAS